MALNVPAVPHLAGRDAALRELGFRDHEASWLTLVCLHSGVFTRTQFCHHHACRNNAAHRFVETLLNAGVARERPLPAPSRHRYVHVHGRGLYKTLDIEHIRHRRAPKTHLLLYTRLLSLDFVLDHLENRWLPTETEKVAHFTRNGFQRRLLPKRTYTGALPRQTRRYFAHKLPIAADRHASTFVYADGGRDGDKELHTWAAAHTQLWRYVRNQGTTVHVAAIVRTRAAQDQYERILTAWLSPPALAPLTPEESDTLAAIERALRSGQPDALAPWGGFQAARRILLPLRQRADQAGDAADRLIDTFSTHFSHRLADPGAL